MRRFNDSVKSRMARNDDRAMKGRGLAVCWQCHEVVPRSDADKGRRSVKLQGCDRPPSGLSAAWVIHSQLEVRVL